MIGYLWIFIGICFAIWTIAEILEFIYNFIVVFKNYLKE